MPLKLDPGVSKCLEVFTNGANFERPALHDISVRRSNVEQMQYLLSKQPKIPGIVITEHSIEVEAHVHISIFQFQRGDQDLSQGPAILHCHGGGMITGSVMMFENYIADLVAKTSVQVFSVDYRLAPESNGTKLTEDCYSGLLWLHENAERLSVDKGRLAVMGESAGGGLAAGVAIMARDRKLYPQLARQILFAPMLDDREIKSGNPAELLSPLWTPEDNITGWTAVLGHDVGAEVVSPYAVPARVPKMEGLPPTYVDVGGLDIFRREDVAYVSCGLIWRQCWLPTEPTNSR